MTVKRVPGVLLVLAIVFSGCRTTEIEPSPTAFKGYKLYSWRDGTGWRYALLLGTNRLKQWSEIERAARPFSDLENALAALPANEYVSWCPQRLANIQPPLGFPPADAVTRIQRIATAGSWHLQLCR